MHQHATIGQVLDQQQEPLVAAGRLDGHLKRPLLLEELANRFDSSTEEPLAANHLPLAIGFRHHADGDTLLVEIDAGKIHD